MPCIYTSICCFACIWQHMVQWLPGNSNSFFKWNVFHRAYFMHKPQPVISGCGLLFYGTLWNRQPINKNYLQQKNGETQKNNKLLIIYII